jgi:hypothetical protein
MPTWTKRPVVHAALWSAVLVIASMLIPWIVFKYLPPLRLFGARRYYLAVIGATTLPLLPGMLVGGGIGSLITFFGGGEGSVVDAISAAVGVGINWYFYFLFFSTLIVRRTRKTLQAPSP